MMIYLFVNYEPTLTKPMLLNPFLQVMRLKPSFPFSVMLAITCFFFSALPRHDSLSSFTELYAQTPNKTRKKTKWERQAEQLEQVRALRRAKRNAKHFKAEEKKYRNAQAEHREAHLKELIKIDQNRALPLLSEALLQREDLQWRCAALKALGTATPGSLKVTALKSMLSPYAEERKSLIELLVAWGLKEGEVGLRDLAIDKSVSVRRAAIEGLGQIGGAVDLLISYALDGPDSSTSEIAAKAWMQSTHLIHQNPQDRIKDELELLKSRYAQARAVGIKALIDEGAYICPQLSDATLAQQGALDALDQVNQALWPQCIDHLLNRGRLTTNQIKINLLNALARWKKPSPKISRFIEQHLKDTDPEIRIAVSRASDYTDHATPRLLRLDQLRQDPQIKVRCAALQALIKPNEPQFGWSMNLQSALYLQLEQAIQEHLPTPHHDTTWLECSLKAMKRLGVKHFDPLLSKAYHAWRRSIVYGDLRVLLMQVAESSPGPVRLELLMEGMLDNDPNVKKYAETALRQSSR